MENTVKQMDGYMENGQGHLVPLASVREIDRERDALVREMFARAGELEALIAQFKSRTMGDIAAFVELSLEQHGVKRGGKKGNICLSSYDQGMRIRLDICESIQFSEELLAARELIDECLHDWSDGAKDALKALVNHIFEVDKQGNISASKILGLRRYKIDDDRWTRAMHIISQSIEVASTKPRLSFQRRAADGQWQSLNLNVATTPGRG